MPRRIRVAALMRPGPARRPSSSTIVNAERKASGARMMAGKPLRERQCAVEHGAEDRLAGVAPRMVTPTQIAGEMSQMEQEHREGIGALQLFGARCQPAGEIEFLADRNVPADDVHRQRYAR